MVALVYKRILDLFEAEGINTLFFGIPDPTSCTCRPKPTRAVGRWWRSNDEIEALVSWPRRPPG